MLGSLWESVLKSLATVWSPVMATTKGPLSALWTTETTGFAAESLTMASWTSVACRSRETSALFPLR